MVKCNSKQFIEEGARLHNEKHFRIIAGVSALAQEQRQRLADRACTPSANKTFKSALQNKQH
jgi:hypothetical protein